MATNVLHPEQAEYFLKKYSELYEPNTKLDAELEAHLDDEFKRYLTLESAIAIYDSPHLGSMKNIDLIINMLGCIYVAATEERTTKGLNIPLPIFNPLAMLEKNQWFYLDFYKCFLTELDTKRGLCQNLSRMLNSIVVLNLFEYIATHWSNYSGYKHYPIPASVGKNCKQYPADKFDEVAACNGNFYIGEYGELRLELVKFVTNQLIAYRMKNA